MKRLISWITQHPVFAGLLMISILLGGFNSSRKLRRELAPQFSENRVAITVSDPDSSPQEIEKSICIKIEEALVGLSGIHTINSSARENGALVDIRLNSGADIRKIIDQMKSRVEKITFPQSSGKPRFELKFKRNRLLQTVLYYDGSQVKEDNLHRTLKEMAKNIKSELLDLPYVNIVTISETNSYEIVIEISKATLSKYNFSFEQIATAIKKSNLSIPGGILHTPKGKIKIYTKTYRYTGEQYKNVVLRAEKDGTIIRLGDVATIKSGFSKIFARGNYNGKPAIRIIVWTSNDQDVIKAAKVVKDYYQKKIKTLPEEVKWVYWADLSEGISSRLSALEENAWTSFVLVWFSLCFFLNLRLSFWVAAGIPVSFAGGFLVLWLAGKTINMISIFSLIIAIGMIVDDAIVVGENVDVHRERGKSGVMAAIEGTWEVVWPVVTSTFTTIAMFTPMFFVSGRLGSLMKEIPLVIIAVLVASLIECFFILPAHLSFDFKKANRNTFFGKVRIFLDSLIEQGINKIYKPLYFVNLKYPIIITVVIFGFSLLSLGLIHGNIVPTGALPKMDSGVLEAIVNFPVGSPSHLPENAIAKIEQAAFRQNKIFNSEKKPLVVGMYSIVKTHEARVMVKLADAENRSYHSEKILKSWNKTVGDIPEATNLVFFSQQETFEGKALAFRLLAKDFQTLNAAAKELKETLAQYPGVFNIEDDSDRGKLRVTPKIKEQGKLLGILEVDIAQQLHQGFSGDRVLKILRNQEEIQVVVRYPEEQSQSISDLEKVRIITSSGEALPLLFVCDLQIQRNLSTIKRENRRRKLTISAEVDSKLSSPADISADLKNNFFPQLLQKYPDLFFKSSGQRAENNRSINDLLVGFQYALLVVLIILFMIFSSYLQSLLIFAIIPFSCIGVVLGHLIMQYEISSMSLFGIVALAGVVVNNSILLIDKINKEITSGSSLKQALEKAGPARFRPIFLTTITTFIGLMPIVFSQNISSHFVVPMAISLSFGLLFSSFLQVFFVPVLFLYLNSLRCYFYWFTTGKWPNREQVEPAFQARFLDKN